MFIRNYGLFWRADEVDWHPGSGSKGVFRLIGRRGTNRPGVRLTDFREQQGIYILYSDYGPYYVGLTRQLGLGKRLRDHNSDKHAGRWDRFSWFGFRSVNLGQDAYGFCHLRALATVAMGKPKQVIGDVEAILIRAMALFNTSQMRFVHDEEWTQVRRGEIELFVSRVT